MTYKELKENLYRDFNEKIDKLKDHPRYEWLREKADAAMRIDRHGYQAIIYESYVKAAFIDFISKTPIEEIREWLDNIDTEEENNESNQY